MNGKESVAQSVATQEPLVQRRLKAQLKDVFIKLSGERRKVVTDFAHSLEISQTLKAPCADQVQVDRK